MLQGKSASCRPTKQIELAKRVIDALPECDRDIFVRHDVDAGSMQHVAKAHGIPASTAYKSLYRTRRRLDRVRREAAAAKHHQRPARVDAVLRKAAVEKRLALGGTLVTVMHVVDELIEELAT